MSGAPKYQVFISSTYDDLGPERDQVIKAVLEMGHIPVGMEMFSAADEQQWQIISRHIDESDYYAVIVAHRLGSLTEDQLSYTRKEYEYAMLQGIPCLGFVIEEGANWPTNLVDTDSEAVAALRDFKNLIKQKPVSFWTSAEDLHGKFSIALMKSFTAQPREGWVRASTVAGGQAAANEIVRLSAENGDLRQKLRKSGDSAAEERKAKLRSTLIALRDKTVTPSYRYTTKGTWQTDVEVTLMKVFRWIGPSMVIESTAKKLASTLAMHLRSDKERREWDIVAINQTRSILVDLFTLDLVEPSTRKHPIKDPEEYWSLSEFGQELLRAYRGRALGVYSSTSDRVTDEGEHEGGNDNADADDVVSP